MGWKFEVAKMVMYISFPVGIFHYFNHPTNFEESLIREKKKYFPPENKQLNDQIEEFIREFNSTIEKQHLEAMEKEEHNKH